MLRGFAIPGARTAISCCENQNRARDQWIRPRWRGALHREVLVVEEVVAGTHPGPVNLQGVPDQDPLAVTAARAILTRLEFYFLGEI